MKKLFLLIAIVIISLNCFAQKSTKPVYNAALAKKLGADKFGTKRYVMTFLKEGSNCTQL